MGLNYLLIIGYVIGVLYSIANKEYTFGFNNAEARTNMFKSLVSGMVVMTAWYFAFFIKLDDNMSTDTFSSTGLFILVGGMYFMAGFCVEFSLKAAVKIYKQYFVKIAQEKTGTTITETKTKVVETTKETNGV